MRERKWASVEGPLSALFGLLAVLLPMSSQLAAALWLVCLGLVVHVAWLFVKTAPWRAVMTVFFMALAFAGWRFTTWARANDQVQQPTQPSPTGAPAATKRPPRPGRPLATATAIPSATPTSTPGPVPTEVPVIKYDFQGQRITTVGGRVVKTGGPEFDAYWKFVEIANGEKLYPHLAEECRWKRLRDLAALQMKRVPDWITAQAYAGIAEIHLYNPDGGEALLMGAERRIGTDPDYTPLLPLIRQHLKEISDPLSRSVYAAKPPPPPKSYDDYVDPDPDPCHPRKRAP